MRVLLLMSLLVCSGVADDEITDVGMRLGQVVGLGPVGPGEGPGEPNERPRILCGRVLADARMIYCFSNSDPQKRSSPSGLITTLYQRPRGPQSLAWQWIADKHALALRSKRDPGLADECCLKPCYISELLSYC